MSALEKFVTTDIATSSGDVAMRERRRASLDRLAEAAQDAPTASEAHRVMEQGRLVAEALSRARQPFEDCWLAGKASVLAARKLGMFLNEISGERTRAPGRHGGFLPSDRAMLRDELGLGQKTVRNLRRLADVPDPEFQRYIQLRDQIPSIHGALAACRIVRVYHANSGYVGRSAPDWRSSRRRKIGVSSPANPSLDEAGSLIVKALGHLGAVRGGSREQQRARSRAMDMLYQAHDEIRPFLGGYVE